MTEAEWLACTNPQPMLELCAAWLTREVRALADGIYAERAFDRMPLLAEALEASDCTNAELIEHCRSGRQHARGCWVVDLLLGKEGEAPANGHL